VSTLQTKRIKTTVTNVGRFEFRSLLFFVFEVSGALPLPPKNISKRENKEYIKMWSNSSLKLAAIDPNTLDDWIDSFTEVGCKMIKPVRAGEMSTTQRFALRDPDNNHSIEHFEDDDVLPRAADPGGRPAPLA
jgi:hypothetical protein